MNIKPADKTIKALLKSGRQFMIPRFQRDYSWEKKNCEEFLDDIIKCLKCKDGKLETTSYFLGTMLFIGNFDEKSDKEIQVVDGQQRITTITILFSAISDIFREKGEDNLSKLIFNYIIIDDLRNGFSCRCARFNLGLSNGMKIEHHNLSYLGL